MATGSNQERYAGGPNDPPQLTGSIGEQGGEEAVERDTALEVETPVMKVETSPDGTSDSGQSFNPRTVRTGGSMTRAIIGIAVVAILVILFVVLFLSR